MKSSIFYNAKIYPQTSDEIYTVMAIENEKIVYLGNSLEEAKQIVEDTNMIDVDNKTILPNFVDSHTHPSCIALTNWRVPLKSTTLQGLLEEARDYCLKHPVEEVPYFFGESFQLTMFDEFGPKKELLDQYINDRPARLQDFTDHSCWYNSKALELMGIVKGKEDPEVVRGTVADIKRYEDGEPTGWVLEVPDDSLDRILYENIGWSPDKEPTKENITPFLNFLISNGVTTVMDAIAEDASIELFHQLDKEGHLNMYYDGCILLPYYEALDETIEKALYMKNKYESKHVKIHTVKFFLDGTNELGDMASLEPLKTDPSGTNYGHINMEEDELVDTMVKLNQAKLDLHLHIVGDRAFRVTCNAMEKAKEICKENWCIDITSAHCEITHPQDRLRPKELGMYINWSCHWAGGYFGEKSRDYLGQERFDTMYDFTQMIQNGTNVAFSSDVFSYKEAKRAKPFFGIQTSATRVDIEFPLPKERFKNHVRTPESAKLSVKDLIYGYTYIAAKQLRLDKYVGSLEVNKDASFQILDKNPYTIDVFDLKDIETEAVYFEGKMIYKKGDNYEQTL